MFCMFRSMMGGGGAASGGDSRQQRTMVNDSGDEEARGVNRESQEEKQGKIEKKKMGGSLDQTMSEQCVELSKEKNIREEQ